MDDPGRAGRVVAVLMIIQMVGGTVVNFVLEAPLFEAPGFLVNAALHPRQLGVAAVTGLITEALWIAIAVTAFSTFWQRSRTMALWFVVLAAVVLAVAVVENISVMSMVSVSQAYAKASGVEREHFQAIRVVVASGRNWAHYIARIVDGATIFVFYAVLYRCALIPRAIAGFGLAAVVLMVTSVARPLFGQEVIFPMLAPLGLSQLVLLVWLMAKGFRSNGT
jgi:uncharacterized protein DUF4386